MVAKVGGLRRVCCKQGPAEHMFNEALGGLIDLHPRLPPDWPFAWCFAVAAPSGCVCFWMIFDVQRQALFDKHWVLKIGHPTAMCSSSVLLE